MLQLLYVIHDVSIYMETVAALVFTFALTDIFPPNPQGNMGNLWYEKLWDLPCIAMHSFGGCLAVWQNEDHSGLSKL